MRLFRVWLRGDSVLDTAIVIVESKTIEGVAPLVKKEYPKHTITSISEEAATDFIGECNYD